MRNKGILILNIQIKFKNEIMISKKTKLLLEKEFNGKLVFRLKASNIFALICSDIVQDTNKQVKNFNEKAEANLVLSNKFRRNIKKMNEHRILMGHYALQATNELADVFIDYEKENPNGIEPLSLFQAVVDAYGRFVELLGARLLLCNEDPEKMKQLWQELQPKDNPLESIEEPDWEEIENLSNLEK